MNLSQLLAELPMQQCAMPLSWRVSGSFQNLPRRTHVWSIQPPCNILPRHTLLQSSLYLLHTMHERVGWNSTNKPFGASTKFQFRSYNPSFPSSVTVFGLNFWKSFRVQSEHPRVQVCAVRLGYEVWCTLNTDRWTMSTVQWCCLSWDAPALCNCDLTWDCTSISEEYELQSFSQASEGE